MTRIVLQRHVAERNHKRRTSSRIACSIILSPWLYLQWQRSAHSKRSTLGPKGKSSLQDAARAESVHRMLFLAFSSLFFDKSQGWAPQSFSHALQMLLAPLEDLWWHGWLGLAEKHAILTCCRSRGCDPATGVFFCHGLPPASASQVCLHAVQLLLPSLMVSRPFSYCAAMLCSGDGALACLLFASAPVELNAVVHLLASWSAAR